MDILDRVAGALITAVIPLFGLAMCVSIHRSARRQEPLTRLLLRTLWQRFGQRHRPQAQR